MKQIAALLLTSILSAVILCSCGKTETNQDPETVKTIDGIVSSTQWGASMEEMKSNLESSMESDVSIIETETVVCDVQVNLKYCFSEYVGEEGLLLSGVYMIPKDKSGAEALKEKITEALGEKETVGYTIGGNEYALSEENRFWHSEKTVADTGGAAYRQKLLSMGYGENNTFGVSAEEYADFMLSQIYPVKITEENTADGTRFYIDANWAVLLKLGIY
ncbi:MAG: hypothetical protein PUB32_01005 [Clostridiales bacterium]|nr:hypothetical protein [Clostridiales bacterium]